MEDATITLTGDRCPIDRCSSGIYGADIVYYLKITWKEPQGKVTTQDTSVIAAVAPHVAASDVCLTRERSFRRES